MSAAPKSGTATRLRFASILQVRGGIAAVTLRAGRVIGEVVEPARGRHAAVIKPLGWPAAELLVVDFAELVTAIAVESMTLAETREVARRQRENFPRLLPDPRNARRREPREHESEER